MMDVWYLSRTTSLQLNSACWDGGIRPEVTAFSGRASVGEAPLQRVNTATGYLEAKLIGFNP